MSNQIEKIHADSPSPANYTRAYLDYLSSLLAKVDDKAIGRFIELILETRENGKSIYFIGNGGSAATASHFANDLQIGTRSKRKPFKVQSLTDNVAILTAIGNDFGYEHIFLKQLEALLEPGDIVVGISASGNSPNILNSIDYAKSRGCKTVGLTGFDGGKLMNAVELCIHVATEKGEYGPVEDLHMIVDHIVGTYLMLHVRKSEGQGRA